ncbi:bifunctional precorrin-2 dehydrogenase/sirohydrochlorin ferrochelatase [Methanolobus sp. ZRKC2]|uniref:precorrin-2 dehydrogenase/sirohydrochlorin ferrochelatase family protein n=1 Tax=Methanolobus sp. ZRKC2 TaxID=3125783 RepID=UPI0032548DFD
MAPENPFLPLLIDMTGRKIVIFGGGSVGERKALSFSRYADVIVISRSFTPAIRDISEKDNVHLVTADVGKLSDEEIDDFVDGAFLVIPATNQRNINERIVAAARKKNILTNQVDAIGDVTVPSVVKRGDLTISISTAGSSPAFSRFVRQNIENLITPEFADMIKVQENLRGYLKENVPDQRDRKELLWQVLDSEEVWSALGESYDKGFKIAQGIVTEKINKKVR